MEKVIFIDRDGVINVDLMGYVERPQDFRFEEGAISALKRLTDEGYKIIVISNQAGVGDGVFTADAAWQVHHHMVAELAKEGAHIFSAHYCLHGKNAGCKCRKPEIGLFKEAEKRIQFDKKKVFFIGDKATDIQAGKKYGIKTAFVRTGHGLEDEKLLKDDLMPEIRANNLAAAIDVIFERYHSGPSKRKPRKIKPPRQKNPRVISAPKTAPLSDSRSIPTQTTASQAGGASGETRQPNYSKPRQNSFRGRNDSRGFGHRQQYSRQNRRDSFRGRDNFRSRDYRPDPRHAGESSPERNDFRIPDRRPEHGGPRDSFRRRDNFRNRDRRPDQRNSGEFRRRNDDRRPHREPGYGGPRDSFRGRDNFRGHDRRPDQRNSGDSPRGRNDFRGQDRRPGFSKRDGSGSNASYRGKTPSTRRTYGRPPRNTPNRPERNDRRDR